MLTKPWKRFSMMLALNKPNLDNLAEKIWKSVEDLPVKFKAHEYQNVKHVGPDGIFEIVAMTMFQTHLTAGTAQ